MDLYQIWKQEKRDDPFYRRLGDECFGYTKEKCLEIIASHKKPWVPSRWGIRFFTDPDPTIYYIAKIGEGLEEIE